MTLFSEMFAASGVPALKTGAGTPVTVKTPAGETVGIVGILGSEWNDQKEAGGGTLLVRRRRVSFDVEEVLPAIGWTVAIGEETWTVIGVEGYSESFIRVVVERPEPIELSRRGYRRS
jgi:hypothetical protein